MQRIELLDMHCHSHEIPLDKLREYIETRNMVIVGVSDDYESSLKTLEYASRLTGLIPCVGLHPWEVKRREDIETARRIVELALEKNIRCIGEVGLDTKFVGETIDLQREVFKVFLEAARDHKLLLNLHTAGTWEEVLRLLQRYDVVYANFHWYTGPLHLLKEIEASGYTISINPAIRIQKKHQAVVAAAPIEIMLTESDSPYEYKGIKMEPILVEEVVKRIAEIRGLEPDEVKKSIVANFTRRYGFLLA